MKQDEIPTIMVVDDYDDNRLMMKLMLEMNGYRVVEAASGEQAIEVARLERLDLIFMDLCLSELDGLSAMRIIREHEGSKHVPFIVISGYDAAHFHAAALAAGCAEYVTKPVDFNYVESLLRRFCPVIQSSAAPLPV